MKTETKKITFDMALPAFRFAMHKFCTDFEIDLDEMEEEDINFLLAIANSFFLTGLHFAAKVGDVEIENLPTASVH